MAKLIKDVPGVILCKTASFLVGKDIACLCRVAKGVNEQLAPCKRNGVYVELEDVFDVMIKSAFGATAVIMHPVQLSLVFENFRLDAEKWFEIDFGRGDLFVRGVTLGLKKGGEERQGVYNNDKKETQRQTEGD